MVAVVATVTQVPDLHPVSRRGEAAVGVVVQHGQLVKRWPDLPHDDWGTAEGSGEDLGLKVRRQRGAVDARGPEAEALRRQVSSQLVDQPREVVTDRADGQKNC